MRSLPKNVAFRVVLTVAMMAAAGAWAQSPAPNPAESPENAVPADRAVAALRSSPLERQPEAFGGGTQWTYYQASEFIPWGGQTLPDYLGNGYVTPHDDGTTTNPDYWVQLHLPNGALITTLYANVYDNSSDASWVMWLDVYEHDGTPTFTDIASFSSGDAPGYARIMLSVPSDFTFREWADLDGDSTAGDIAYSVHLNTTGTHADVLGLAFGGVAVGWHRTISPAPAVATFGDVPTDHWAFQFVEALADSGITAGCGGGNYCPDNPITRAEMAVYLAAALGLHWPS